MLMEIMMKMRMQIKMKMRMQIKMGNHKLNTFKTNKIQFNFLKNFKRGEERNWAV